MMMKFLAAIQVSGPADSSRPVVNNSHFLVECASADIKQKIRNVSKKWIGDNAKFAGGINHKFTDGLYTAEIAWFKPVGTMDWCTYAEILPQYDNTADDGSFI